ncbi:MAG: AAA family ATPase [Akkermansia sp.]|uniref:AAA family ATPase n=1 Tax=Akkermansia sp. TaxID=1872421 RepID=UPI00399C638F
MNAVRLCNSSKIVASDAGFFYVTGKKGIGKTLLLLRLANDLAKKKICTTVYYVEIEGKDSSILHKCLEMIGIPPR